jgi:hypothetical protein
MSGVWQEKGFGLGPKKEKGGLGCGKIYFCSLSYTVDVSGVWQVPLIVATYVFPHSPSAMPHGQCIHFARTNIVNYYARKRCLT